MNADGDRADVEVARSEDGWDVTVQLPGVMPEDLSLQFDDRELCIRVRSDAEADVRSPGLAAISGPTRDTLHRVSLPAEADPTHMSITFGDEVLMLHLSAPRHVPEGAYDILPDPFTHPERPDPAVNRELHRPGGPPIEPPKGFA